MGTVGPSPTFLVLLVLRWCWLWGHPRGWRWPQLCPCEHITSHGKAPLVGSCQGTWTLHVLVTGLCPTSLAVMSWRGLSTLLGAASTPGTPCPLSPGLPVVLLGEERPPVSPQLCQPHWYSVPVRWQLAGWEQSDSGDR